VLRLTGAVVSGYSRTCIGPAACFDEIYANKPESETIVDKTETEGAEIETEPAKTETPVSAAAPDSNKKKPLAPAASSKPPAKKSEPAAETGQVFDFARGERARKSFILRRLRSADSGILSQRLLLLALAQQSGAVRMSLSTYGVPGTTGVKLAEAVFEIHADSIPEAMHGAATAAVMSGADSTPEVWQFVADRFGVDIPREWHLTEAYLTGLNKSEIIRIGEEPGVGIWVDPAAVTYRQDKYVGKALMALKKEDLIDIMLNSGAVLTGRVPAEVLGERGKK
jgi:hypothetical protein